MKKLTKSRTNRVMDGVLGGFGEYFNIDPIIVRILYVIFTFTTAFAGGVILYIIAMVIIPEGDSSARWNERGTSSTEAEWSEPSQHTEPHQHTKSYSTRSRNGGLLIGMILIVIGGIFLINNILDVNIMFYLRRYSEYFWGIGLVVVGLFIILMGGRRR